MEVIKKAKMFMREATELGVLMAALGIVMGILTGTSVPFLGNIVSNITNLVRSLGDSGIVGLISLGIIAWVFTKK